MGTKNLNSATDLITFTRASGGTALRKISYGSELVTNGDFDGNIDGWTGGSYDAVTGDLSLISSGSVHTYQTGFDPTKKYLLTYTVSEYTSGNISAYNGLVFGSYTNAVGTYSIIISPDVQRLGVRGQNGPVDAKISNISVKEVTFDQPDGTLQLFNHPDNVPRIEYDADGTVKGLLIEEARTNLVTTSSGWNTGATNVSFGGYTTAPDGTNTGSLFITDATGNYSTNLGTVTTSSTNQFVTFSVFFKKELARYATFKINKSAFDGRFWYDFDTGNTGFKTHPYFENRTFSVENYPNGWKRMSISFSSSNISGVFNLNVAPSNDEPYATYNRNITGDGTQGVYFWGAQGELASFPTSYIPTTGATATRSADVASIPTSAFGYNSGAGTVVVEFDTANVSTLGTSSHSLSDGTAINTIETYTGTSYHLLVKTAGVTQVALDAGTVAAFSNTSIATTYRLNNFAAVIDGGSVVTDTVGTLPDVNVLQLGANRDQAVKLNGHIKSIKYYPRRLTNTQLQELTT